MSATTTPEIEAVRAVHATALRIIADLHAAYGKGVDLHIDAGHEPLTLEPRHGGSTWVHLYAPGASLTLGFWDDGDMYADARCVPAGGHLMVIETARTFIHRHGYGSR